VTIGSCQQDECPSLKFCNSNVRFLIIRGMKLALCYMESAISCVGPCGLVVMQFGVDISKYSYAPHNDVSVNDGRHIRRWYHNVIMLTTVLQLPTEFSTVTCCTDL